MSNTTKNKELTIFDVLDPDSADGSTCDQPCNARKFLLYANTSMHESTLLALKETASQIIKKHRKQ